MDESILIERLRRNDRKAYSDLFDGYFDKLFTFALNMVFREDVANDIVQEVFIAIYEKSVLKNSLHERAQSLLQLPAGCES